MRVCRHGCDVTLSVFPRYNLKPLQSRLSNSQVLILGNSNEENFSKLTIFSPLSLRKESKKKKNNSALHVSMSVSCSELDDLVEGAQAKTTKYVTKYAR